VRLPEKTFYINVLSQSLTEPSRNVRLFFQSDVRLSSYRPAQIGAITGHSQQTIHTIMKHYLVLDSAMARQAIDKVDAWMAREGITL